MSGSFIISFPLYEELVESKIQDSEIIEILTRFKGHVKKELVDVSSIGDYFRGLFYVLDKGKYHPNDSMRILTLAHSSLCYLIKRVAMQCPRFLEDRETISELMIHLFMFGAHGSQSVQLEMRNFWISSSRALEGIQVIEPLKVQDCILGFIRDDSLRDQRSKLLLVMDEILQISEKIASSTSYTKKEIWKRFKSPLLELLNDTNVNGVNDNQGLDSLACDIILKHESDKTELRHWISLLVKKHPRELLISKLDERSRSASPVPSPESLDVDAELQNIFQEFQVFTNHYSNDQDHEVSVYELSHNTLESLQHLMETFLIPFQQPKENEKNWKLRQENLILLRRLIRNEFTYKQHPIQFLGICRDLQLMECVGKAALSLRTTLSTTACLVMKDFLQILPSKLDSCILDQMFESLRALLSSSKKIASTNAFNCLVIMFSRIDFHNKLFQNCFMLINQKAVLPKSCSAILLRIFLIKFHHTPKLENSMIYIEEWLKKGIVDAQTTVREAMRKTFWYYYKCYPIQGKKFLQSQLSSQLRKAVELSIPERLEVNYQTTRTINSSASSSVPNFRRTSFGPRKSPSYAQPTQSSNSNSASGSVLQRATNARSNSEYVLRENAGSNNISHERRKISAPYQQIKRSLTTIEPQEYSQYYQDHRHQHRHNNQHRAPFHRSETSENSLQLDLTGEIPPSPSNSLIKKHMNYEIGSEKNNLEIMYRYLESPSSMKIKDGLQILQNNLLVDISSLTNSNSNDKQILDFDRLLPLIRNVMLKLPQELKPLLSISRFWQSIPLRYLIELYAINCLTFSDELLRYFPSDALLWSICETLGSLDPSIIDKENDMSPSLSLHYMKYKQFIFNFCFHLLTQILHGSNMESTLLQDSLGHCILQLARIAGQEYDETLYFDTLYQIYQYSPSLFVEKIRELNYISIKLKICKHLELRDKSGMFNREAIVSRQSLDGIENHQIFQEELRDNDLVDDRRVMEMTMVNPFNRTRSGSGGSVVHHSPNVPDSPSIEKDGKRLEGDRQNGTIEDDDQKRLSEITKVVSIYQRIDQKEDSDQISNRNPSKVDQDVEMMDIPQKREPNVNLSDIFGNAQDREATVKFSKEPPRVINSSRVPSSSVENTRDDDVRTLTRRVSRERDKSPVTPLTDHQSMELSNAINSIELGRRQDISLLHENRGGSNLSAEILANAIRERENDEEDSQRKMLEFDLMEAVPNDSLIYHEVTCALPAAQGFEDIGQVLNQMKKAISRIENRSFSMKQLNILIAPLIRFAREESLRSWLELENGYNELLQLSKTLFHSTDETKMVPMNLVCKSIVLIQCLILINNDLRNVVPISSPEFKMIWRDALALINRLSEYSSEIYCLLQEFRDILVFLNFFETNDIANMLYALINEIQDGTSGMKETFLMETLSLIVSRAQVVIKPNQIMEIEQAMQLYVESRRSEWRLAGCELLSQISQHSNPMSDDRSHSFEGLSRNRQRIIQALSSD